MQRKQTHPYDRSPPLLRGAARLPDHTAGRNPLDRRIGGDSAGCKSFFDTDPRNIFDIHEIRYDNRYAIDFDDLRYARNPQYRTNYELLNGIYLFTFTVADYTYATRKGKPLVTNYGKDGPAL